MATLPDPTSSLSPQGQELYRQLVAKRGRIDGMYRSLLHHPELTRQVSDLGAFLRFGSGALPATVRELVILWVARELGAAYEWVKHEPVARQAGLSADVIEAIQTRRPLTGLDSLHHAALSAARCVLQRRSIPQPVQDQLAAALGLPGVVELVVLCGFYEMIAGVIFAFEVPLPPGAADPFESDSTPP